MNRSRYRYLLFLAALLAWGQVLAAPFLPCRHEVAGLRAEQGSGLQRESSDPAASAAGMVEAHAAHMHHHGPMEPAAAVQPPALQHDGTVAAAATGIGCDLDCRLHCLSVVLLALPALTLAPGEDAAMLLLAAPSPFPPAQPPVVHFRPPQTA